MLISTSYLKIMEIENASAFLQSMIRLRLQRCRYILTKIYQQSLELKRKINLAEQRCTLYVHRGNRTYRCHVTAYRCLNTSKCNRNVNHLFLKSDKNHLLWMGVRLIKRLTLSVVEMSEMLHSYTHIYIDTFYQFKALDFTARRSSEFLRL